MTDQFDPLFLSFQAAVAGTYSLERELARGGMGIVYLARDVRLDRPVAIKLLPPELGAQPQLRERFLREARTAAKLSHPYIVPIFAVDEMRDFVFFAMAYVEGETLAQRVAVRGPLVPFDAARILREVAWALAYAHAQGVVHRDIKPANILLERGTGRALVADFGIARLVEGGGQTTAGERLGTPEFMSPEQASGEPVDARSDLYSLGVVAFHALTGQLPFSAPTVQAMLAQHITRPAPLVGSVAPGVPRALAQAIDRCLQKDPAARFGSAEALANALSSALEKRADVPVPVRVFLDRRKFIALLILTIGLLPVLVFDTVAFTRNGGALSARIIAQGLLMVMLPTSLVVGVIIRSVRKLLALGYGPDDLVLALRASFERRREEFQFEHGLTPSARERAYRMLPVAGFAAVVATSVAMLSGVVSVNLWPAVVVSGYLVLTTTLVRTRWNRLRRGDGPVWGRFWGGHVGRALCRVAGLGLRQRAIAADRPTELAIAMSAEALFANLPKELRQSLTGFPDVVRDLEGYARRMRERLAVLDASSEEAQRTPVPAAAAQRAGLVSELHDVRERAQMRLQEVITALETLRLDLLRLRAGAGTVDSVTADLAAARELGAQTDRLLKSRHEVDRLLAVRSSSGSAWHGSD